MKTISLACTFVLVFGGVAGADDKAKADQLFKQGKKLMGEKKYAEACSAFEDSFKLDPGIGGELNIAKCFEEWGKLGRAYKSYQHAAQMAKDANDPRAPKIDDLVKGLDPQVPRITIKVSRGGDPSAVSATLDGSPVDPSMVGKAQMVDPGPHTIEYKTDSGTKKKVVPVERGNQDVFLDVGSKSEGGGGEKHADEPDRPRASEPVPGRNQRIAGLVVGGAGVAAIGVASYMTLSARSKYNDALSAHCGGMTNNCDDTGLTITHDARHEANIATVVFVLGGAAIGGGIALYLLAPKPIGGREHAMYIVPTVGPDGGGFVVGGKL